MAVRTTMSHLISHVRNVVNDTDSSVFTDQNIQDYLDQTTLKRIIRERLSKDADETVYSSQYGMLEMPADESGLFVGTGDAATEVSSSNYTADLLRGEFVFSTDQNDVYYLDAVTYDVWSAIAMCFEQMAFDPTKTRGAAQSGGVLMGRQDHLQAAVYYRRQAPPRPVKLKRAYH